MSGSRLTQTEAARPGGAGLLDHVRAALQPHGLFLRGVLHPDDPPLLESGRPAGTVLLVGHVGSSLWPAFSAWRERADDGGPDPLDRWSKAVVTPIAHDVGASVWFPSDPPWQPFQRWAMQAEGLKASPLGILMHPVYGLWHGYRAALGLEERLPLPNSAPSGHHPCDTCRDTPCLSACPVGAVTRAHFDVAACRAFLPVQPGAACLSGGCLARAACPVGAQARYDAAQLRFHMAALKL